MPSKAAQFLLGSAVIFLLLCITLSTSVFVWYNKIMKVAGPHQDDVTVVIVPGSRHNSIRHVLNRAGVLHQVYHEDVARILAGNSFSPKSGEFLLPAKTSLNGILSIITLPASSFEKSRISLMIASRLAAERSIVWR